MSGSRFKITVQGEDQFSPVVGKVNQSIRNLHKPIGDTQAGLRRLADSPAIDQIGKSLSGVGTSALDAVGAIGKLIPSIGTLAGIGTIGAGIQFVGSFNAQAAALGRANRLIGVGTGDLQRYQYAASMVAIEADSVTGSLDSLAGTLEDAVANRNQEALGLMAQLGIRMRTTKEGAIDVVAGIEDIAEAFDRTRNAGTVKIGGIEYSGLEGAKRLAQTMGVGDLIPLLLLGKERIKEFGDEFARIHGGIRPEDIKRADDYTQSMNRLNAAVGGAANRIGAYLTPALIAAADAMTGTILDPPSLSDLSLSALGKAFGVDEKSGPVGSPYSFKSTGVDGSRSLLDLAGDSDTLVRAAKENPISTPHSGSVHVAIEMKNAPHGTVASVRTQGNVEATARVETTLPQYGP